MSDVRPRDGGRYSLFCYDCRRWIPNTANHEMRKEGAYAYSHVCFTDSEGNVEVMDGMYMDLGIPEDEGLLDQEEE